MAENTVKKNRRRDIDIIKGLAIILMVYGHTFGIYRSRVYLFHMPVFFMVSGYCWNDKHTDNAAEARRYIFDRLKRLMIPYIVFNLLFVLLTNFFIRINVYTDDPDITLQNDILPFAQRTYSYLGGRGFLQRIYQVLCFDHISQMAGASWFLYALFFICMVHCGIEYGLKILPHKKVVYPLRILIFIFTLSMTYVVSSGAWGIRDIILPRHYRLFACYLAYLLGFYIRKLKFSDSLFGIWQGILSFIILCCIVPFGTLEMSTGEIVDPLFFILSSIAGWILLGSIAKGILIIRIDRVFEFIGKHTIPILFLHLLGYKAISLFYVLFKGDPLYKIAMYTVIFETPEYIKIIYTIAGVGLPLFAYLVSVKGYKKIRCCMKN